MMFPSHQPAGIGGKSEHSLTFGDEMNTQGSSRFVSPLVSQPRAKRRRVIKSGAQAASNADLRTRAGMSRHMIRLRQLRHGAKPKLTVKSASFGNWQRAASSSGNNTKKEAVYRTVEGRVLTGADAFAQSELDKQRQTSTHHVLQAARRSVAAKLSSLSDAQEQRVQVQPARTCPSIQAITARPSFTSKSVPSIFATATALPPTNTIASMLPSSIRLQDDSQMRLDSWQWCLPTAARTAYQQQSITKMYPWQFELLSQPELLLGRRNLAFSAPTSAGKTFVAEMLLLIRLLERNSKAIFVVPFVSLVDELTAALRCKLHPIGIVVRSLHGVATLELEGYHVAVCTLEKANGIINKALHERRFHEFSCVVVDEVHMLGETGRGSLIEALLSKVRAYQSGVLGNVSAPLQVIVMSATLPSLDPLATWLNAHTQSTQFRPIPVTESILCGTQLYDRSEHCSAPIDVAGVAGFKSPRPFSALPFSAFNAANHGVPSIPDLSISALLRSALSASASGQKLNALQSTEISKYQLLQLCQLCAARATHQLSVIIFAPSRLHCERTATALAEHFSRTLQVDPDTINRRAKLFLDLRTFVLQSNDQSSGLAAFLRASENSMPLTSPADSHQTSSISFERLETLISAGVCFHHAGLLSEERLLIETAFRNGTLLTLVATSTLATGVNLPASCVIFREFYIGTSAHRIDATRYQQMRGRCGRSGVRTSASASVADRGECIVICSPSELKAVSQVMMQPLTQLQSQLLYTNIDEHSGRVLNERMMRRLVLDFASLSSPSSIDILQKCIRCTFMATGIKSLQWEPQVHNAVEYLISNDLLRRRTDSDGTAIIVPSQLGVATFHSGVDCDQAVVLSSHLLKSRQRVFLSSSLSDDSALPLQLAFLIAPVHQIELARIQFKFNAVRDSLSAADIALADFLHVDFSVMNSTFQRPPSVSPSVAAPSADSAHASIPEITSQTVQAQSTSSISKFNHMFSASAATNVFHPAKSPSVPSFSPSNPLPSPLATPNTSEMKKVVYRFCMAVLLRAVCADACDLTSVLRRFVVSSASPFPLDLLFQSTSLSCGMIANMCESMRFDGFWALCLLHGPRFRRGAVGDLRANPVAASLYEAINEGYLESEIRERSLKPRHIRCLVQAGITSVQKVALLSWQKLFALIDAQFKVEPKSINEFEQVCKSTIEHARELASREPAQVSGSDVFGTKGPSFTTRAQSTEKSEQNDFLDEFADIY